MMEQVIILALGTGIIDFSKYNNIFKKIIILLLKLKNLMILLESIKYINNFSLTLYTNNWH